MAPRDSFTSLPTSWAIATFGVRKGMGFGVILMGIFGLVRGFFGHNYTIVLIATVMLSIAQPFIINSITTMSARWFAVHERATATGIAMLAQFIGIMAGMAVSPILAGSLGNQGHADMVRGLGLGGPHPLFCVLPGKTVDAAIGLRAGGTFRHARGVEACF